MERIIVEPNIKEKDFKEALDEWKDEKDNVIAAFDEDDGLWLLAWVSKDMINFVNVTSGKTYLDYINIENEFMMQALDNFEAIMFFNSIESYKQWLLHEELVEYEIIKDDSFISCKEAQKKWSRNDEKVIAGKKDEQIGTLQEANGIYTFVSYEGNILSENDNFKSAIEGVQQAVLFKDFESYKKVIEKNDKDE